MRQMESRLSTSSLDWVCLRPPRLLAKPARGDYVLGERPVGGSITHADLAAALIDAVEHPVDPRRFLFVANR